MRDTAQMVVDAIVDRYAATVRRLVSLEYGCSVQHVEMILSDETGLYDNSPEYNRYYELLEEYVRLAEHA